EDRGAILRPDGTELPVWYGRIDVVPEDLQQLIIRQPPWIVEHLHGQRMARAAGSDVVIGWISFTPPGITNDRGDDPIESVKWWLQAPEAATGKSRLSTGVTIRHVLPLTVEHFHRSTSRSATGAWKKGVVPCDISPQTLSPHGSHRRRVSWLNS